MSRRTLALAAIAAIALSMMYLIGTVNASTKVTICHATGSDSNPFTAITIDQGASAFPHLDSNGSPLSGHEQDFLLPFEGTKDDCAAAAHPSATPAASASAAQSAAQSVAASAQASAEGSVKAGTGTPAGSTSNTAFFGDGVNPLPTIVFSLILLASLGTLAYANVKSVRSRI